MPGKGAVNSLVEAAPETGRVRVDKLVAADDCGAAVNLMLVDGQVRGSIVHGLRGALMGACVYDRNGQLRPAEW